MALRAGPLALMAGPALEVDLDNGSWRWLCVLTSPPFAFELTLAASDMDFRSGLWGINGFAGAHESEVHEHGARSQGRVHPLPALPRLAQRSADI